MTHRLWLKSYSILLIMSTRQRCQGVQHVGWRGHDPYHHQLMWIHPNQPRRCDDQWNASTAAIGWESIRRVGSSVPRMYHSTTIREHGLDGDYWRLDRHLDSNSTVKFDGNISPSTSFFVFTVSASVLYQWSAHFFTTLILLMKEIKESCATLQQQ